MCPKSKIYISFAIQKERKQNSIWTVVETLPRHLTILARVKVPGRNNPHFITQAHIRLLTPPEPCRPNPPFRTWLSHCRTIGQAMRARSRIHASRGNQARGTKCLPRIARFSNDSCVLMEDVAVVGIYAGESSWYVFVEGGDDSVLGDIFHLVGLRVGIGDVGVLVVVVDPVRGA
jgi:hypothetical protein